MNWELIHTENREGFDIQFWATEEDDNPNDHFDDGGETARLILNGVYDWFIAKVTASRAGVELGADYLGGCAYETAGDFMSQKYYEDMVAEAISQARNALAEELIALCATDLLATLQLIHANAAESPEWIRAHTGPAIERATGVQS